MISFSLRKLFWWSFVANVFVYIYLIRLLSPAARNYYYRRTTNIVCTIFQSEWRTNTPTPVNTHTHTHTDWSNTQTLKCMSAVLAHIINYYYINYYSSDEPNACFWHFYATDFFAAVLFCFTHSSSYLYMFTLSMNDSTICACIKCILGMRLLRYAATFMVSRM